MLEAIDTVWKEVSTNGLADDQVAAVLHQVSHQTHNLGIICILNYIIISSLNFISYYPNDGFSTIFTSWKSLSGSSQ